MVNSSAPDEFAVAGNSQHGTIASEEPNVDRDGS